MVPYADPLGGVGAHAVGGTVPTGEQVDRERTVGLGT